jgi:hypothetical protein
VEGAGRGARRQAAAGRGAALREAAGRFLG